MLPVRDIAPGMPWVPRLYPSLQWSLYASVYILLDKRPRWVVSCFRFFSRTGQQAKESTGLAGNDSPGRFGRGTHTQCTAMSKRSRVRCKGTAMADSPSQKCRMHSGKGSIGVANPMFKSGRYSKYLPSELDTIYREALANPELIEMGDHIALLESRMQQLLAGTAEGNPQPKWSQIRDLFAELSTALLSGDAEKVNPALEQMQGLVDAGMKWDTTWNQIGDLMEQLRKLTDTEVKRKKELNQMIPVERVVIMMAAVATAVKRNVKDPDQVAAVYRELDMLHSSDRVPGNLGMVRVPPTDLRTPHQRSKARKKGNHNTPLPIIEITTGTSGT